MKIQFNIFFSMLLFFSSFSMYGQNDAVEKISFTTLTRGAHREVVVTKDCVSIVKQGIDDEKELSIKTKISSEEWKKLLLTLKEISLADISAYQAPSNKRAYDGAWHSTLIITTTDKKSFRHSFDNEDPNEKLKPLMTNIHTLIEKVGPVKEE